MSLKVALEWFLNPDHLPFIAGIVKGAYAQHGVDVELIEPSEHYDGFEALQREEVDVHVNEPIHLFEHYYDGIKSLGCYFETRGGVMIKEESIEKLRSNQKLKITTPVANEVTDKVGFEILKRYAQQEGFGLDRESVEFIQTDFYHLKNMQEGDFDGAWLCFYNFEVIEADHIGFKHLFIDQFKSPYANFSALEIITSEAVCEKKGEQLCNFILETNHMIEYLYNNVQEAKQIYYNYSKSEKSELMDKIIEDTLKRFRKNFQADDLKWSKLYEMLHELKLVTLTQKEYKKIWDIKNH